MSAHRAIPRHGYAWKGSGVTIFKVSTSSFLSAASPLSPAFRDRANPVLSVRRCPSSSRNTSAPPVAEEEDIDPLLDVAQNETDGRIVAGMEHVRRLVRVDQKPIGRTPRSNLSTYSGMFDHVRRIFADTPLARRRHYSPGRFSFNVAQGRCPVCEGEGYVMVELLFLPSVFAPCSTCHGSRYNPQTLEVEWNGRNIAQVLELTVDDACDFFAGEASVMRSLDVLREIGLGYLRLGQPTTELSGGEAQRIKLATELQRAQRGTAIYILDEPRGFTPPMRTG